MTGKELEQIYNEAYRAVYWTAMSLLKNEADAEDIAQDTFVALIESYESIKDKSKVVSWLKKTAANKCLDRIKLAKTDNMDDEFFESVEAVPEDFLPDSIVESDEMRKIVMDIIEKSLSDDVRRTLILFYFDEMSTKEIAEALGIPQGTVLWRLNFAKKKIKKEVEKYEDDNNTKLFTMALPFLSKLFIREAEQVEFKPMPASIANLSASAESQIAKAAVKKGTEGMLKKIVIGSVAAALVTAAATAGIVFLLGNKLNPNTYPTETAVSTESETTTTTEQETTTTEETTTSEETTTTEETTSEETTTEETTSAAATKAPTKAATKKSSVPAVPKGWVKIKGCWGKKVNGRKVYAIAKKPGVSTWTFKGWYNGKWVKLYEDDYSSDPEGAITTIDFYLDKNLKKFYCRYVD